MWVPVQNLNDFAVLQPLSSTNYRGVLHDFSTDSTGETTFNWSTASTGNREPENLNIYDTSTKMDIWTLTLYQTSFNKMVQSVATYGGFYIGRYEMSKDDNEKAQSKAGVTSVSAAASTDDMPANGVNQWYGLYKLARTYESSSVTSEMIWGCQYDAMLRWIAENGIDITTNSTRNNDTQYRTGVYTGDKLCNIYDLLGCRYEWSQEAEGTNKRVFRGGKIDNGNPTYYRGTETPSTNSNFGTRLTLYINS